jgi:hypothetical protein
MMDFRIYIYEKQGKHTKLLIQFAVNASTYNHWVSQDDSLGCWFAQESLKH